MKALSELWRHFWEPIDNFLSRVGLLLVAKATHIVLLLVALAVVVMVSESVASCLQGLLGLNEKYDVLKTIGFCVAGVLLVWQAGAANKRAKAMEDTAGEQARATENTEKGQRQERLKNAIEHLGHKRDSVRMGGAYELFHLAKDTENLRQTVLDILCSHIRQMTTGQTTHENDYQAEHKTKPSEEIQSLLTLLFVQKHDQDVFENCSINLQGSYLNGATLVQARLKKANLWETQLQGADLSAAQLQEAGLFKAQMQGVILEEALLQEAILREAQLQRANLFKAQLQGADLWEARLQRANLQAQLQGADFWAAQMQGANLWNAQMQETDLRLAQLQGAYLSQAQMQGANLREAQLQGAYLREAQLQEAELDHAQLQGVSSQVADRVQLLLVGSQEADDLSLVGFENEIRDRIGKPSDLTEIIFAGGLQEEDLNTLCEGLSDDQAQVLRETLRPHVGKPASHELPKNSGAATGAYTQEEAEQWIAEYQEAIREVPKRDDG